MEMDELGTARPIIPLFYLLVFTWHSAGIHAQHTRLVGNHPSQWQPRFARWAGL